MMTSTAAADDGAMTFRGLHAGGPKRRSWTRAAEIAHIAAYRAARDVARATRVCATGRFPATVAK